MKLADIRKEYVSRALDVSDVLKDPLAQFEVWFQEAVEAAVPEPTAMTLATANAQGLPSARVVLLKGLEDGFFVFYTNYMSRKGQDMTENPYACLNFFWPELERQVRIEGEVSRVAPKTSDEYYHSRPRGSQIGAHVSPQSSLVPNRDFLAERMERLTQQFAQQPVIPRPDHWGGFAVKPQNIEFWQGRPNRLHDRILYTCSENGWEIARLAP